MSVGAAFGMALKVLVLPPACVLALYGAGWLLRRRRPRLGAACRHGAVLLLYFLSTGVGAWLLAHPLEMLEPVLAAGRTDAQAIVVLTAGRVRHSPEYGGRAAPDFVALERITYAAHVARATGLPLLVSGGLLADDDDETLGGNMRRVFEEEFHLPVRWAETVSRNTAQNATLSARMLRPDGVTRIILVTDAMHMRRARLAFERAGLAVTPAPTFFVEPGPFEPARLLPNVESLRRSHYALYEWFGLAWYRLTAPR